MKRLAHVVDTFSECANSPVDPPVTTNLPPQSMNMPYPVQQMQPQQAPGIGSMDGLLNFLPFPGFGTIDGSMAQFIPGNEMELAGWTDMEFLMEGYGDANRSGYYG